MALGDSKTGLTEEVELDIPEGASLTTTTGTTGSQLPQMKKIGGVMKLAPQWKSWSPGDVMQFIETQSKTYGGYIPEIWDCEDHAYLAAADVRRRFEGQPVGILLGKGKFGGVNIVNKYHAINILWFEKDAGDGKKVWYPRFFDPTLKPPREITKELADPPFDTQIVISVPIGGSPNKNDYKDFAPYGPSDFIKTGTFALDRTDYDYSAIDDAKKTLAEWNTKGYGQSNEIDSALFTPTDQAFYYFAHIRRWYVTDHKPHPPTKALPVGFVVGKIESSGNDYAALILWKSKTEFIYWDVYGGEAIDSKLKCGPYKLKPRVVMV
jgi:hypothetical protein